MQSGAFNLTVKPFDSVIGTILFNFKTNVMVTFKNYTPHAITLNDGTTFQSEGVARVSASFSSFDENGVCTQLFGEVEGLPEPACYCGLCGRNLLTSHHRGDCPYDGCMSSEDEKDYIRTIYVVSAMVLAASNRTDLVAPATGHPDTVRNEKGHIVSVPGFVR